MDADKKITDFYGLVSTWTYNDYVTPKIKAEIIIDMLISDFVEDMFNDEGFERISDNRDKAVLLAKEFPIKGYTQVRDLSGREQGIKLFRQSGISNSPSVDFLVKKGRTLYLTELKTNKKSYEAKQAFRMIMAAKDKDDNGDKQLFKHYAEVLKDTESKVKYEGQLKKLIEKTGAGCMKSIDTDALMKGDAAQKQRFTECINASYDRIEIVYLTLDGFWKNSSCCFKYGNELVILPEADGGGVRDFVYKTDTSGDKGTGFYIMAVNKFELPDGEEAERKLLWEKVRSVLRGLPADKI